MTAVAVWKGQPNADDILQKRLQNGWQPTASPLQNGEEILGYAACLKNVRRT